MLSLRGSTQVCTKHGLSATERTKYKGNLYQGYPTYDEVVEAFEKYQNYKNGPMRLVQQLQKLSKQRRR